MKKSKSVRKQEIVEKNAERLNNLISEKEYFQSMLLQKQSEVETAEKLVELSNKRISIKKANSQINPETKRPFYEEMQEYIDVNIQIEELDFKERKEPSFKTQITMTKGDVLGLEKAIADVEESIRVSSEKGGEE